MFDQGDQVLRGECLALQLQVSAAYERRALRMSKMRSMVRNIVATDQEIMLEVDLIVDPLFPVLDDVLKWLH
jgi:hypothetical protein